ncbi:HET-domain-containing protein [Stipitochalara longipes BDJ]|nr:HET-domain-containing protein [Stipitochalara longipes BDJ]
MSQAVPQRPRYEHRPLKTPDSTRILHLQPGHFTDDIHVQLTEIRLSEAPSYEALSYVWGSPTPEDPIFCHGDELLVTANCIAAMRRLRHERKARLLWIDGICINQSSTTERNHQVQLMGDIYSRARKVLIWLGEESPESDFVMSFFKTYYRIWKWLAPFRRPLLQIQLKRLHNMESKFANSGCTSILSLICDNTWFERKWTVPEYVLSRVSYFQYGSKLLHSPNLFASIKDLDTRRPDRLIQPHHVTTKVAFRAYIDVFNKIQQVLHDKKGGNTFKLLDILVQGRSQKATEPRDAVFALYGVMQRMNVNLAPPNYSRSTEDIYTEIAKLVILHDKSLQLLERTAQHSAWNDLPSWVPNWNTLLFHGFEQPSPQRVEKPFAASRDTPSVFTLPDIHTSLLVRGFFVDKIQRTARKFIAHSDDHEALGITSETPSVDRRQKLQINSIQAFQEWICIAGSVTWDKDKEELKDILLRTLNHDWRNQFTWLAQGFEEWLECFGSKTPLQNSNDLELPPKSSTEVDATHLENQNNQIEDEVEGEVAEHDAIIKRFRSNPLGRRFLHYIYYFCQRTRFFVTSSGRLGKGLKDIQEGDYVALIAGVDMPMILRKEGDLYRSKGPAYIHGTMFGETWPKHENDLVDILLS